MSVVGVFDRQIALPLSPPLLLLPAPKSHSLSFSPYLVQRRLSGDALGAGVARAALEDRDEVVHCLVEAGSEKARSEKELASFVLTFLFSLRALSLLVPVIWELTSSAQARADVEIVRAEFCALRW